MKVIILRGIPGSGKSTVARALVRNIGGILSTDDFFMDAYGGYYFKKHLLSEAHQETFRQFINDIKGNVPLIVVDNTNISSWEIAPYYAAAEAYGYEVEIVSLMTRPEVAWARQTHGVPRATFDRMVENFDKARETFPAHWNYVEVF